MATNSLVSERERDEFAAFKRWQAENSTPRPTPMPLTPTPGLKMNTDDDVDNNSVPKEPSEPELMRLLPPPTVDTYSTHDEAQEAVQKWAVGQGYAISRERTNIEKNRQRCWLRCTRGSKPNQNRRIKDENRKRDHHSLTCINCQFMVIISNSKGGHFKLRVKNGSHSHPALPVTVLANARKQLLLKRIVYIIQQIDAGSTPKQILNGLLQRDPFLPLKERDLYNIKSDIRKANLQGLTPIQALLQKLKENPDFYSKTLLDKNNKVIGLFFSYKSSQHLLRANSEVLIMDCTYKTNKFRMPLFDIVGIDCLQRTFYAGFCFLAREDQEHFEFALASLQDLLHFLGRPPPQTLITDKDWALMAALAVVFSDTRYLLCR